MSQQRRLDMASPGRLSGVDSGLLSPGADMGIGVGGNQGTATYHLDPRIGGATLQTPPPLRLAPNLLGIVPPTEDDMCVEAPSTRQRARSGAPTRPRPKGGGTTSRPTFQATTTGTDPLKEHLDQHAWRTYLRAPGEHPLEGRGHASTEHVTSLDRLIGRVRVTSEPTSEQEDEYQSGYSPREDEKESETSHDLVPWPKVRQGSGDCGPSELLERCHGQREEGLPRQNQRGPKNAQATGRPGAGRGPLPWRRSLPTTRRDTSSSRRP